MNNDNFIIKILELQEDWEYLFNHSSITKKQVKYELLTVVKKDKPICCPFCLSKNIRNKGYSIKHPKVSKIFNYPIIIEIKKRKFICNNCKKTFIEEIQNNDEHKIISRNLILSIMDECREIQSFSSIGRRLCISTSEVIKIFLQHFNCTKIPFPTMMGIDEFHFNPKIGLCFVIRDLQTNEIYDILPGRDRDTLDSYFNGINSEIRDKVRFITMDLWETYRSVCTFWFKNALLIADRFHYTKLVIERTNAYRIAFMKKINEEIINKTASDIEKAKENYYLLKKFWKSILSLETSKTPFYSYKYKKTVTMDYILDKILNIDNEFTKVYNKKNDLLRLFDQSDIDNIEINIDKWIDDVKGIDIFIPVCKTIKKWMNEIKNSFYIVPELNKTLSNATTEGGHTTIKNIKRIARGYKNFDLFKKRVLFITRKNINIK